MLKSVFFDRRPNRRLEVVICAVPDWEGFDKLIEFLKREYSAEILVQADGPGARKWVLKARGKEFALVHDDGYGNYLYALSPDGEALIEEIGKDLEDRFDRVEREGAGE